jgi:hypothetical protein
VVQFHQVPSSTGDWKVYEATFGKAITKKQTFFGYCLHLMITLGGLILDFVLTAANCTDLEVCFELLSEHFDYVNPRRKCTTFFRQHCASNFRQGCATQKADANAKWIEF